MKKEKIKKFLKENKNTIILGTIATVALAFSVRAYKRLSRENKEIRQIARDEVNKLAWKYEWRWQEYERLANDKYSKSSSILDDRFNKLKIAEALVWPIRGQNPIQAVTETAGLSGWGGALRGAGIFTLGDLIRFVRTNNGAKKILSIPGIGEIGYESIIKYLLNNTTPEFQKTYNIYGRF